MRSCGVAGFLVDDGTRRVNGNEAQGGRYGGARDHRVVVFHGDGGRFAAAIIPGVELDGDAAAGAFFAPIAVAGRVRQ